MRRCRIETILLLMSQKRVACSMSEECAAILKEYCSFFNITQSEALYLFARAAIHQHALHCKKVESILKLRLKELDKRAGKICFGYPCLSCVHAARCAAGLHDGLYDIREDVSHLLKPGPLIKVVEYLSNSDREA